MDTPLVYFNNLAGLWSPYWRNDPEGYKDIGHITRLRRYLQRNSLLTIYKAFIIPHLDYEDVVSDYPGNVCFMQKLESVQYNTSWTVLGCFQMYAILHFTRPIPMFKINRLSGFFFLTRLRVGFSHLREHKFRHGFWDILGSICSCCPNAVENTEHYILYYYQMAKPSKTTWYKIKIS